MPGAGHGHHPSGVAHPVLFVAAKLGLTWFLWTRWDKITEPGGKVVINAISCAPVPWNIRTIRQQQKVNGLAPPAPGTQPLVAAATS